MAPRRAPTFPYQLRRARLIFFDRPATHIDGMFAAPDVTPF